MVSESALRWVRALLCSSFLRDLRFHAVRKTLQQSEDRGIISSPSNSRLSVQRPVPIFHSLALSLSVQMVIGKFFSDCKAEQHI